MSNTALEEVQPLGKYLQGLLQDHAGHRVEIVDNDLSIFLVCLDCKLRIVET